MLEKKPVSITVDGSIDAGVDPKVAIKGPITAENGRFSRSGALIKRTGRAAAALSLLSPTTLNSRLFATTTGNVGFVQANGSLGVLGTTDWVTTAAEVSTGADIQLSDVVGETGTSALPTCYAEAGAFTVGVAPSGAGGTLMIYDSTNGLFLTSLGISYNRGLVSLQRVSSTQVTYVYIEGTNLKHGKLEWTGSSVTATTATGTYAVNATDPYLDTVVVGSNVIVVTKDAAGKASIREITGGYTGAAVPTLLFASASTVTATSTICRMAGVANTNIGWAASTTTGTVVAGVISSAGAAVIAETSLMAAPAGLPATSPTNQVMVVAETDVMLRVFHNYRNTAAFTSADLYSQRTATLTTGPTASATSHWHTDAMWAAKPFRTATDNSVSWVAPLIMYKGDPVLGDTLVLWDSINNPIGIALVDQTAEHLYGNTYACFSSPENTGGAYSLIPVRYIVAIPSGLKASAIYGNKIVKFRSPTQYQGEIPITNVGGSVLIGGALPSNFDGISLVEQGYLREPADAYSIQLGTGTSKTSGAVYRYALVFAARDNLGNVVRSAPFTSETSLKTTTSGIFDIQVNIPTLTFTGRFNTVVEVYGTQANGDTYYYLGSVNNVPTTDIVSYTDNVTDASRTVGATLYTTGNTLPVDVCGAYKVAAIHQNRLFVVDNERRNTRIKYTQPIEEGAGVGYSGFLTLDVPPEGGEITALFSFIDKLIVFKQGGIYAIDGEGPDLVGLGTTYSRPWRVSANIGAKSTRLVARIPQGLIYQSSDHNIYALNNSMGVQPIGERVLHHTDTNTYVAATAVDDLQQVRFLPSTADAPALIYDYLKDAWTTYTNYVGTDSISILRTDGSGTMDYYFVDGSGNLQKDRRDRYYDDSATQIPMRYITGSLAPWGLGGYGRIYKIVLIGQHLDVHTLRVKIRYDDAAAYSDDMVLTTTGIPTYDYDKFYENSPSSGNNEGFRIQFYPGRTKCSSFGLYLADDDAANVGANWSLTGIVLEVGVEPTRAARLPRNRSNS